MSRWLLLVATVIFAAFAGWWLLRPTAREAHAVATPMAEATTAVTEAPQALPSHAPLPEATPATLSASPPPSALPSVVSSAEPTPREGQATGQIALIVDDCGQWLDTERAFIALQIPLTVSVLPDVRYTTEIASEAAAAGKGVMLHLPMETLSGLNPGPGKVTTAMSDPQIAKQVEDDLKQVPLARGVNNHEGSKASADERVMRDVIGVLADHGDLFFVDSRTNAASVGESTAQSLGVPAASRDVFLDNRNDVAYTEAQLLQAAAIARRTGHAIAIGHPRPTTLEAVRDMIPRLSASGIQFVLVADMVKSER